MLCVYKYDVPTGHGAFTLDLPEGSQILSVGVQDDRPRVWALVDLDKRTETRQFFIAETGKWFNGPASELVFIGTFLLEDDSHVIHLFERVERTELQLL